MIFFLELIMRGILGSKFIEYNGVIGGELMPDTISCSGDMLHIELHAYIARICSHEV